jgi:hypothetical protein
MAKAAEALESEPHEKMVPKVKDKTLKKQKAKKNE